MNKIESHLVEFIHFWTFRLKRLFSSITIGSYNIFLNLLLMHQCEPFVVKDFSKLLHIFASSRQSLFRGTLLNLTRRHLLDLLYKCRVERLKFLRITLRLWSRLVLYLLYYFTWFVRLRVYEANPIRVNVFELFLGLAFAFTSFVHSFYPV